MLPADHACVNGFDLSMLISNKAIPRAGAPVPAAALHQEPAAPEQPDAANADVAQPMQMDEPPDAANATDHDGGLPQPADMVGINALLQDLDLGDIAAAGGGGGGDGDGDGDGDDDEELDECAHALASAECCQLI